MATTYLGAQFDIHGGGVDLVFPHHENERAQSQAAGDPFARYWVHNAWVTMAGEKMSKSLGNVVAIDQMLRRHRAAELRYYLIQPHYRSTIEYSDSALSEAAQAYRRIEQFLRRAGRTGAITPGELAPEFVEAMDNDLATPTAIAVIHNVMREGNAALEAGQDEQARAAAGSVRAMMGILGLDPLAPEWAEAAGADTPTRQALSSVVEDLLAERQQARAARDFARADAVRDRLLRAGITVEDTPDGPLWTVKDA